MSKRDYYDILEVKKTATEAEIKKAYRTQSKKYHPDVNPEGEEQFKEVAEAYETLSNTTKKQKYDTFGHGGQHQQGGGFGGFNMSDIFNRQVRRKGQDIVYNINITLEDAFNGITKKFKYKRNVSCDTCNGLGGKSEATCGTCQGHGYMFYEQQTQMGRMRQMVNCNGCNGSGKVIKDPCGKCNSKGTTSKEGLIEVKVPCGISIGETLRYGGMGHAIKGGESGNLLIRIIVLTHKKFVRNGSDLRYTLKLTYSQLVLGDKIQVPTIDGKDILITVPKYSGVGDALRIVNKGMQIKGSSSRGDMIVALDIKMPSEITDEEKELLEKLKNIGQGVETLEK